MIECTVCHGAGQTYHDAGGGDGAGWETCRTCKGMGVIPEDWEACARRNAAIAMEILNAALQILHDQTKANVHMWHTRFTAAQTAHELERKAHEQTRKELADANESLTAAYMLGEERAKDRHKAELADAQAALETLREDLAEAEKQDMLNCAGFEDELDRVRKERDKLSLLFMDQMVALMQAKKDPCKQCIVREDCIEKGRCCSDWALEWAKGE